MSQTTEMPVDSDMRAWPSREVSPQGYRLMTVAEARRLVESSGKRLTSFEGQEGPFRLMNGFIAKDGGVVRGFFGAFDPEYKLLVRRSAGEVDEYVNFEEEDYLVALALACMVDDVDNQVEGLVKRAGKGILCKEWENITPVNHCAYYNSNNALARVLQQLEESCTSGESQQINYNLDDFKPALSWLVDGSPTSYEEYKTGASHLLRHAANVGFGRHDAGNDFLSCDDGDNRRTALGWALDENKADASKALLDASKEIFEDPELMQKSPTWLSTADIQLNEDPSQVPYTHLYLAVTQFPDDAASSAEIVDKILDFPGAKELKLTPLQVDIHGNTLLHIAVVRYAGKDKKITEIFSKLLQYMTSASLKCELDKLRHDSGDDHLLLVNVQNKRGETALHLASRRGFTEGCRLLLKHGASIQLRDEAGRYALTDALYCDDDRDGYSTAEVLLNAWCNKFPRVQEDPTVSAAVRPFHDMSFLANAKFQFDFTALHVAAAFGLTDHMKTLLRSGASPTARSKDGKTPLHIEVLTKKKRWSYRGFPDQLDAAKFANTQDRIEWINMADYFAQTALHLAILRCTPNEKRKEVVRSLLQEGAWVDLKDSDGDTPLHLATRKGHEDIVDLLLKPNCKYSPGTDKEKWISMCNFAGETALHVAAKEGHKQIARKLIQHSKFPHEMLLLRDVQNRTALQVWDVENDSEALPLIEELLQSCKDKLIKHFLLWDTLEATTSGTKLHSHMKKIADAEYKQQSQPHSLLERAIKTQELRIARQLINRGADITTLDNDCRTLISGIFCRNASDQPALQDSLGRKELVIAVASLLLNPYTGTPISIGVFGNWGTGKSSFMQQVEGALLCMATKQNFRKESASQSQYLFGGKASMLDFSQSAAKLRRKVTKALFERMSKEDIDIHEITEENVIEAFPIKLHSQYTHSLLKEVALVDRSTLVQESSAGTHEWRCLIMLLFSSFYRVFTSLPISKLFHGCGGGSGSKSNCTSSEQHKEDAELSIGHTPTVMIVHYNAWHYYEKTEAVAGLAVDISRELEESMTPSQWLRMCFMYSWQRQPIDIFVKLILPLLTFFFASLFVMVLWRIAQVKAQYKLLTLPLGVLGVVWVFFKMFLHFIQPITEKIVGYMTSPDHSSMLGYHHRVINDLTFIIDQLCMEPTSMWKAFGYLGQIFMSNSHYIKGTSIHKQHPARPSNLRIVVFIDDLDRCEDKTILEVLRAINLILAACGMNVVIGVDKGMVERAIARDLLKDTSDKVLELVDEEPTTTTHEELAHHTHNLAKRYLQKIIQLPVEIPEPSTEDLKRFLKRQIGKVELHENKAEVKENTSNTANQDTCLSLFSEIHEEDVQTLQEENTTNSSLEYQQIHENTKEEGKGKGHMFSATAQDASPSMNFPTSGQVSSNDIHEDPLISTCQDQAITVHVNKDWKKCRCFDTQESGSQSKDWKECRCFGAQESGNQSKDWKECRCFDTQERGNISKGVPMQNRHHLLLTNYSPMEEDLILKLSESANRDGKAPREWKRFLNYHRLCWSILSQDNNMLKEEYKGWQTKLILWIFICWNWTKHINKIIEVWEKLLMDYSSKENEILLLSRSPTLGDMISFYIKTQYFNDKDSNSLEVNQKTTQTENSSIEQPKEKYGFNMEAHRRQEETSWNEICNTLKKQHDLSMRFVNAFQKFRFYCDLKVLTIDQKYIEVNEGDHQERSNLVSILNLRHGE